MDFLKKNWLWIVIVVVLLAVIYKNNEKKTDANAVPNVPGGTTSTGGIAGGIVADVKEGVSDFV
jgi:hypothetical protein